MCLLSVELPGLLGVSWLLTGFPRVAKITIAVLWTISGGSRDRQYAD
jgi:hypothetical protein